MATPFLLTTAIFMLIASWCETLMIQSPKWPKVCAYHAGCMQGIYMPGYQSERFEAFLGIPYALPPVQELRFSQPKAYPRLSGIFNASIVRDDCIQKNYLLANPVVYGAEDCLYLNVYRPVLRPKTHLPVMVYIHGGGWFAGSASPVLHGPEYFMDTQEVILVTFAYRLGAFGFLSTNDVHMPGNFGLKDQNLALRWVKKNIAYFGGNPNKVTIFGQSAGAVSAHMHMLSKQSEGLFHSVIALSGTANVPFSITENPLEQARLTAEFCNITNARDLSTAKLTRALRRVDALTLVNSGDGLKYWHVDHMTNYRPVVENADLTDAFLTQHPRLLIENGNYTAVPWMAGGVPQEGAVRVLSILENDTLKTKFNAQFFELLDMLLDWPDSFNRSTRNLATLQVIEEYFDGERELNENTWQGFLDTVSDRGFLQPFYNAIHHYVLTMDTVKNPVYLYKFNYRGAHSYSNLYSGGQSSRDYGVIHCDDLIYLFRAPILFPDFAKNSTEAQVIKAFVGNFVHFAKYGKPTNSQLLRPCNNSTFQSAPNTFCDFQEFMNTNESTGFEIKTERHFKTRRIEMWNNILAEPHSFK